MTGHARVPYLIFQISAGYPNALDSETLTLDQMPEVNALTGEGRLPLRATARYAISAIGSAKDRCHLHRLLDPRSVKEEDFEAQVMVLESEERLQRGGRRALMMDQDLQRRGHSTIASQQRRKWTTNGGLG